MRVLALATLLAACTNDPLYLPNPVSLEAGTDDGAGELTTARAELLLPIKLETAQDAAERATRAAALGIDVPYVKLGDVELSIEYTIKNLTDMPGTALVELNGANELFAYDPTLIVLSTEDDAPPTPGLDGDIPFRLEPNGTYSDLFREDAVREAQVDLDQITRGNVNPFAATLTISKNADSFQPMTPYDPTMPDTPPTPTGTAIPREAFAGMVRVDVVFKPDRHMVLEFTVRMRDVRGIVDEELQAADPAGLTVFAPAAFTVTAM
ncbi:MAG: hypothetical protein WKG01_32785 [Kofleriaceae bacterium]